MQPIGAKTEINSQSNLKKDDNRLIYWGRLAENTIAHWCIWSSSKAKRDEKEQMLLIGCELVTMKGLGAQHRIDYVDLYDAIRDLQSQQVASHKSPNLS